MKRSSILFACVFLFNLNTFSQSIFISDLVLENSIDIEHVSIQKNKVTIQSHKDLILPSKVIESYINQGFEVVVKSKKDIDVSAFLSFNTQSKNQFILECEDKGQILFRSFSGIASQNHPLNLRIKTKGNIIVKENVVLNTNGGEIRLQAFEESKRLKKNATNKIEVFGTLNASSKQQSSSAFRHIFLSKNIQESCLISLQTKEGGYTFPLYLNPENKNQQTIYQSEVRTPNLNSEIVKQIADNLGLTFTNEKETTKDTFAPIDILDYIYAVLHSPTYREKYKEFLKIDFPRVPYPKDKDSFWKLVKLGREIREIHLLESPTVEKYITQYPIDGDNVVVKPKYQDNKVYINDTQYFNNVPQIAWEFYIGGYQPAQKWLKDRKDRKLEFDDILHYQKIVVALTETDRLMKEIDKIEIL
jgi:DNA-directed RNA polymerase subunit L